MRATILGRSVSLTVTPSRDGDEYHLSGTSLAMKVIADKLYEARIAFSPIDENIHLTERYLKALDTASARALLQELKSATLEIQR